MVCGLHLLLKGGKLISLRNSWQMYLDAPNEGIKRYYSHKEVPYEGYSQDCVVRELLEGKADSINVSHLRASNQVLLSAISQMVIPRTGKSNIPTSLEIFYCCCILCGLPLNLPYIYFEPYENGSCKQEG